MRTRRDSSDGLNLDSLLDTMTNVVGILVIVLATTQLQVGLTIRGMKDMKTVTPEEVEEAREQLEKAEALLAELREKAGPVEQSLHNDRADLARLEKLIESLKKLAAGPVADIDVAKLTQAALDLRKKLAKLEVARRELERERGRKQQEVAAKAKAPDLGELRIPQRRPAPKGAEPLYFICRFGRIFPLEPDDISKKLEAGMRKAIKRPRGQLALDFGDMASIESYFKRTNISTRFFRLKMVNTFGVALQMILQPRSKKQGESFQEIMKPSSDFSRAVKAANRKKIYMKYLVWSDSFETYLAARNKSDARGLAAGWIAYDEDEELKETVVGGGSGGGTGTID